MTGKYTKRNKNTLRTRNDGGVVPREHNVLDSMVLKKNAEEKVILQQVQDAKNAFIAIKKELKIEKELREKEESQYASVFDDLSKRVFVNIADKIAAEKQRKTETIDAINRMSSLMKEENKENMKWRENSFVVKFHKPSLVPLIVTGAVREVDEIKVYTFTSYGDLCYMPLRKKGRQGRLWLNFPISNIASITPMLYPRQEEVDLEKKIAREKILKKMHPNVWLEIQNGEKPLPLEWDPAYLTSKLPKERADQVIKDIEDAFDNQTPYYYEWQTKTSSVAGYSRRYYGTNHHYISIEAVDYIDPSGKKTKQVKAIYATANEFKNDEQYLIINPKTIVRDF